MIPLAILCGGLGTRVRPYTETLPKPMIDVAGIPFLGRLLGLAAAGGIRDVVLLVGYRASAIVDYVGTGKRFGLRVEFAHDGAEPRGTAGAIVSALHLLGNDFFVSFGDAYLDIAYDRVHDAFRAGGRRGLMTVYPVGAGVERANTAVSGGRVSAYSKEPHMPELQYVDAGLSVFHASAFEDLAPTGSIDLTVVNQRLIANDEMTAVVVPSPPLEIGSIAGLEAARAFFLQGVDE